MRRLTICMIFTIALIMVFSIPLHVQANGEKKMAAQEKPMASQQMKMTGNELFPPNAKPGECYARVFVPPTYKTVTETTLKKEASNLLSPIAPQFKTIDETVLVKDRSERWEIIPAKFGMVEEKILVEPEHVHLKTIPPVYETVTEKIMESPAQTVWKKGTGPIQKIDHATGEIMCLIEIPATYKTISKRVLVKDAAKEEIITPAKYTTVSKQIMTEPPSVRKVEIPAEYKTIQVSKLVSPATVKTASISEEFQTVSRQELATDGRMEWQAILCETNIKPGLVISLQKSLAEAGFNPGAIDGTFGSQTMTAVKAYQLDKGLPEGHLTMETLKSLGIKY